ncbi:hypothetical protein [Chamaesiphon sp. OTE_75_metabat_556]|uniref:hypothetical protein n=1 Tax=Chamaesiphon sp. OTE_75_metabat_556 TaxID=2964692 RepID=UPI00286ABA3E|nr:hypothetical protein [Chamaesiphon sp. OTE_75_metabat_556]
MGANACQLYRDLHQESRSPKTLARPPPEQIDRQRDAERVLKQGENLKREIRDNGSDPGNTQRQVDDQINKVRESESDPQKVRAAEAELTRIRQQNNRYYYDPYYSTPGQIIFSPWYGTTPPVTAQDRDTGSGLLWKIGRVFTIASSA